MKGALEASRLLLRKLAMLPGVPLLAMSVL
jgi:hypothetical protein